MSRRSVLCRASRTFPAAAALAVLLAVQAAAATVPAVREARPPAVELETAALLLSGQQGGAIPMGTRAEVAATERAGGETMVPVAAWIALDGPGLLAAAFGDAEPAGELALEVYVYALGADLEEVVDLTTRQLILDVPRYRELAAAGIELVAPLRVPPGDHTLRVLVRAGGAAIGLRSAPIAAGGPAVGGAPEPAGDEPARRELAPGVYALAASLLPAAAPSPDAAPDAASRSAARPADATAGELATRYRQALRRLAAGERDAALAALRQLEIDAVDALGSVALGTLEAVETDTVAAVAAPAGWRSLLPVILLHADAARAHREARRHDLSLHALRVTVSLALAYARRVDGPEAAREAAWILGEQAAYFLHRGPLQRAADLYARALELTPDGLPPDPDALLGLAAIAEKSGGYAAAAGHLARLVEAQPDHAEARLRLALNLARTGDVDAARRQLRGLRDRPRVPEWVAVVAAQELARLALDAGDPAAAATTVRDALRRWPDHPTFQLQLAYLLDLDGDRPASRRLLAALAAAGPATAGERARYNRWPELEAAARRRTLDELAAAHLADLGALLQSAEDRR